jgi:hypothetical protein
MKIMNKFFEELDRLKVELPRIKIIPRRMGIYFLLNNRDLQYIGKSVDGYQRIRNHLKENRIIFDDALFLDVLDPTKLDVMENTLINYFKPPCNSICKTDFILASIDHVFKSEIISVDVDITIDNLNSILINNKNKNSVDVAKSKLAELLNDEVKEIKKYKGQLRRLKNEFKKLKDKRDEIKIETERLSKLNNGITRRSVVFLPNESGRKLIDKYGSPKYINNQNYSKEIEPITA